MKRGFLLYQFNWGNIFGISLLVLFGAGLFGCGSTSEVNSPKPVVCTPQVPNTNIYRVASTTPMFTPSAVTSNGSSMGVTATLSQEQVIALLQGTVPTGLPASVPTSNDAILGTLVNETKSWSDVETIKLDDLSKAQIVLTFISPQLIQAVYDSEVSYYGSTKTGLQTVLADVASREELIFFVTVITSTNNNLSTTPHKIQIPIQKMAIVNADDVVASPLHDDHILAQSINTSFEPVFGYLTYPIAMKRGAECSWVLNPDYNKRIIITVPDVFVDGVSAGSYTWIIPYSSLFKAGYSSNPQPNIMIDSALVSGSLTPPSPMVDLLTPNGLPESTFWQIYAGFLWRQVMQGIY